MGEMKWAPGIGNDNPRLPDNNASAASGYKNPGIQKYLPPELRNQFSGPILQSGMAGLADLIRNPGGMNPNIASAIAPWLASQSQSIGQNFQGIQANQAGAAARNNLPVSIKNALSSAIDVAQERAQRGARMDAMTQSEALRREDLMKTFDLLNQLFQFTNAGRGSQIQAANLSSAENAQNRAATMQFLGTLASAYGTGGASLATQAAQS